MPIGQLSGDEQLESVSARLHEALQRVSHNMEQLRQFTQTAETSVATWQREWRRRQVDLSRRMAFIEAELQRLSTRAEQPRLAVCSVPADGEEMTSMRPF